MLLSGLRLLDVAGQLHISFAHSFETHLGLRLRAEETRRCTRHVLARREWIRETQEPEIARGTPADAIEGKFGLTRIARKTQRLARGRHPR